MKPSRQDVVLLLLCALVLVASGCRKHAVHAAPPAAGVPRPPKPSAASAPPAKTTAEAPPRVFPTPPAGVELPVPSTLPAPTKPRTTPADHSSAEPAPPKPAPPQISPRLSPEEQALAERRTNEDIGVAERNLQVANGRQLDTAKQDLAEKIRGFLGQAREAMRDSDWVRARNLAQKARVLSVELLSVP